MPGLIPALIEFPHDTTRTITSLLFSGTLSRLPGIRFIFSHGGGTMSVLASRLASLAAREPELAERIPNGVQYELEKLYFEVASFANSTSMAALMDLVPTSQILFGSDYAYIRAEVVVEGLAGIGLSLEDARAIDRENASRLLPRADRYCNGPLRGYTKTEPRFRQQQGG
jgi:predicted TIM-barrel fold metal-dependent hydrolase